jgi:hypothetical protein
MCECNDPDALSAAYSIQNKLNDALAARLAEAETQNKRMRYALQSIADEVYDPWTNGAQAQRIALSALEPTTPRFAETFCSQCGGEFGPGDSGYSHCSDHRTAVSADGAA